MKHSISIFSAIAASLLICACAKLSYTQDYDVDTALHQTGDITLCVSIENMGSKATVDNLGHFLFKKGDKLDIALTDGSFATLELEGSGETKRAFFKGTIPTGKEASNFVVYPSGVAKLHSGNNLSLELPSELTYGQTAYNCPMVGLLEDDFNVNLSQLTSYLTLSVSGLPPGTSKIAFEGGAGRQICGPYDFDVTKTGIEGLEMKKGDAALEFNMNGVGDVSCFSFPVPVGSLSEILMTAYDENGEKAGTQSISGFSEFFIRARAKEIAAVSQFVIKGTYFSAEGGGSAKMEETAPGIFEATIDVPQYGNMFITIDSVPFGFEPYSGAGGIGYCKCRTSALPFYSYTAEHTQYYYVERSIGIVKAIEDGGTPFWLEIPFPGKVHMIYDTTREDGPKYYMELVKEKDPNLIFCENFDLCTGGGDANWYLVGSKFPDALVDYDGYSPMLNGSGRWNYPASDTEFMDYPVEIMSTLPNESYIKSRGFEDWIFCRAGERPVGIQLNQGNNYNSYLITPKFSAAGGTVNATLTVEISRFSATSVSDITLELLGGGSFVSGSASFTTYSIKNGKVQGKSTTYDELSGNKFIIGTDFCPTAPGTNSLIDKPVSTYILQVDGITPDSQLKIDASFKESNPPRAVVYSIKLEKR